MAKSNHKPIFEQLAESGEKYDGSKKLNLGAGDFPVLGYENLDGKLGDTIYPLSAVDVDEIRVSHVLEHFPHWKTMDILRDWVKALKPGGVLKIAVPDFRRIAQSYLDGEQINPEPFLMGGQIDDDDYHKALFDEETLREMLRAAGLRGIRHWKSEIKDCAALPISLNLQGTKPLKNLPKISAVMSAPRLGFMDNHRSLLLLQKFGIGVRIARGAYWGPCLTRGMEEAIEQDSPDWILTIDYDSVFGAAQIEALVELAARSPHIDALTSVQINRSTGRPLFVMRDAAGNAYKGVSSDALSAETVPVHSAHFGLTMIRVETLKRFPRPWFYGNPDSEGRWGNERVDDDIAFWNNWHKAGNTLHVAMRVPIGHLIEKVMWPDENLEPVYQDPSEFWKNGAPENVWR